jgi:hypothetical protein
MPRLRVTGSTIRVAPRDESVHPSCRGEDRHEWSQVKMHLKIAQGWDPGSQSR